MPHQFLANWGVALSGRGTEELNGNFSEKPLRPLSQLVLPPHLRLQARVVFLSCLALGRSVAERHGNLGQGQSCRRTHRSLCGLVV